MWNNFFNWFHSLEGWEQILVWFFALIGVPWVLYLCYAVIFVFLGSFVMGSRMVTAFLQPRTGD